MGYTMGGGKDKCKGKIGKTGGFRGSWCGQWSHTTNNCPEKDAYIDLVRNQCGNGAAHNNQKVTFQSETSNDQRDGWTVGGDLETLETPARFADAWNLKRSPFGYRFHVLTKTEADDQNLDRASSMGKVVKRKWETNILVATEGKTSNSAQCSMINSWSSQSNQVPARTS